MADATQTIDLRWSFYCRNIVDANKLSDMIWAKWTKADGMGAANLTLGTEGPQMFDISTDILSRSTPSMPYTLKLQGWSHPFELEPEFLRSWIPQFMRECMEVANFIEAVCEYKCEPMQMYGQITVRNTGIRNSYLRSSFYPNRSQGMPDEDWLNTLAKALDKNKTTEIVSCHGLGLIRDTIPAKDAEPFVKPVVAPPNVDSIERSLQRIADALEKLVEKWGQAPALTVTKVETQDVLPNVGVVPCKSITED